MNDDIRATYVAALLEIAPEIDAGDIEDDVDVLDAYDLDSMDLLNVVTVLHERLGIDIPEQDYPELRTLRTAIPYLGQRTSAAAT